MLTLPGQAVAVRVTVGGGGWGGGGHTGEEESRPTGRGEGEEKVRRSYCWARMSGTLGLSERRGGASWPLRLLNMGSVDRGGAAGPRLPAMVRSSSPLPWMVWWWYSWILERQHSRGGAVGVSPRSQTLLLHQCCQTPPIPPPSKPKNSYWPSRQRT